MPAEPVKCQRLISTELSCKLKNKQIQSNPQLVRKEEIHKELNSPESAYIEYSIKIPALFYTTQMSHILLLNYSTQESPLLSRVSLTQFVHGPRTELSNKSTELSRKVSH